MHEDELLKALSIMLLGGALKQMWQTIVNAFGGIFGADQNVIDEATGLSVYEKNLVRTSWEQAMKNKKQFGVGVFVRLFTKDSPSQDLFDQLRGIPTEELETHRKLKAHAMRVMASLQTLVEGLDEPELLIDMLKNVAKTHRGMKVFKRHYEVLGNALIEQFEEELKGKFTPKAREAWLKAYGVMLKAIMDEYNELGMQTHDSDEEEKTTKREPECCEVTGLSVVEKDLIRKSWVHFMKSKNENATLLIINLFKMSEGAQDQFPKFKGEDPDDLTDDIRVRSHGLRVVAALNSVVENLDDTECLVDMLKHIAHSHHPRGPQKRHFQDLGNVVVATLEQSVGKKFTEETKNAWVKAYGVILSVIVKEYDVIEENANEEKVQDAEATKNEKIQQNGDVKKGNLAV